MKENHSEPKNTSSIPPLEIIDLDLNGTTVTEDSIDSPLDKHASSKHRGGNNESFFEKHILRINWHIILLLVFLVSIGLIVYKISTWGNRVESDYDPNASQDFEFEVEVQDNILPHFVDEDSPVADDGITTVLAFGNAPFADAFGENDNLAVLIENLTDNVVVHNCAVEGSYLAASQYTFLADEDPMDAFNFFWLTTLAAMDNTIIYEQAFEAMGDTVPAGAREAFDILSTIDMYTVDVITVMYDGSDYLAGRPVSNPDNNTDIQTFYGNLNAGIEKLHEYYPHLRIIVMSPTFAYALDENGEYVSSDLYLYNEYPLSTYAMMLERGASMHTASFLDHFYGTVNELNADQYLEDHLHLNAEGRKKVAERFVFALEYYDE